MNPRPPLARLIRGAVLAPLLCFGHGSEFILARLDTATPGEVRLDLTADYGRNPLLTSEEEARRVLPGCLHLLGGGGATRPLAEIATPEFEFPDAQDPAAPLPPDPFSSESEHLLITARFRWKTSERAVQFTIPRGSRHDVLLWQPAETAERETSRWQILLGGDLSSEIALPGRAIPWLWSFSGAAVLLGAVLALPRMLSASSRRRGC